MLELQRQFLELALARQALRFGEFTLKSGRVSPYFFNAGLFNDGESIATLGGCYAGALLHSGLQFDMLFGPAYKGIPLVTATAIALAEHQRRNVPWAFNRKESQGPRRVRTSWSAARCAAGSSSWTMSSPPARRSANRSS